MPEALQRPYGHRIGPRAWLRRQRGLSEEQKPGNFPRKPPLGRIDRSFVFYGIMILDYLTDRTLASRAELWCSHQHIGGKFGEFIEKEHAVMGKAGFARPDLEAAADQGGHGRRMVWRAKGAPIRQGAACQFAGNRLDHRNIKQFARTQRRQNRRKA